MSISREFALLTLVVTCLLPVPAGAQVWADGRDAWALFESRLVNRQLRGQLEGDELRLGRDLGPLVVAGDLTIGSQFGSGDGLARFHGFFLLDAFAAVEVTPWIDVNLNLIVLDASASDGYRASSRILPGLALHLHHDLFDLAGDPVRADFVAPDLDIVTMGRGLLVEEQSLAGYQIGGRWRGFELRQVFGGRLFWNDDLWMLQASALKGAAGASLVIWGSSLPSADDLAKILQSGMIPEGLELEDTFAWYLTAFGEVEVVRRLRIAAEGGLRVDHGEVVPALLVRADWLDGDLSGAELHLGWQLRYYAQHFTPVDLNLGPSVFGSLPEREEAYFTNAFEYLAISRRFHQVSHSVMAELHVPLHWGIRIIAEAEGVIRFVSAGTPAQVRFIDGQRLPGILPDLYYRAGLEVRPSFLPRARLSALVTNKLVNSDESPIDPVGQRFVDRPLLALEIEVDL